VKKKKSMAWKGYRGPAPTLQALDVLDGRLLETRALRRWRADLVKDLGGADKLTLMQRELVEQAVRLKCYLDRADEPHLKSNVTVPTRDRTYRKMLLHVLRLLGLEPTKATSTPTKKPVPSIDDLRKKYAR
jgi:hypothetical protein